MPALHTRGFLTAGGPAARPAALLGLLAVSALLLGPAASAGSPVYRTGAPYAGWSFSVSNSSFYGGPCTRHGTSVPVGVNNTTGKLSGAIFSRAVEPYGCVRHGPIVGESVTLSAASPSFVANRSGWLVLRLMFRFDVVTEFTCRNCGPANASSASGGASSVGVDLAVSDLTTGTGWSQQPAFAQTTVRTGNGSARDALRGYYPLPIGLPITKGDRYTVEFSLILGLEVWSSWGRGSYSAARLDLGPPHAPSCFEGFELR
jgi:hypothetical protein